MNARPQAEGESDRRLPTPRLMESPVPRQTVPAPAPDAAVAPRTPPRTGGDTDASPGPDADEAAEGADAAGVENLLRCWVRETGGVPAANGTLSIPLTACGTAISAEVHYWSPTGYHRFGPVIPEDAPPGAAPLDAVTLAALLAREAAHRAGGAGRPGTELVGRVADSVRRTAVILAERRARPEPSPGADPFLAGEQSLLLGHPLHPTPKSREGLSEAEARRYAPELCGSFPLHWMAATPDVVATDSAWTEAGRPVAAARLAARLAGPDLPLPPGTVPIPLHPWQAREVAHRPAVARMLADGLLLDLGEHGEPWYPTSSLRTVHRPGAPAMIKLSLALRITNSRRENLRKELHRGVEIHRLLRTGLGERWRASCPAGAPFDIVRDPAWLGVDDADGRPLAGLDTVFRHNPFGPADDVLCAAALTALSPASGGPPSRLTRLLDRLASRTGRRRAEVAAEWFLRYLETVIAPVLRLDALAGIALEAHQQNTLIRLDGDGWPAGGWYRDNQGFYLRQSRHAALRARLPELGTASEAFVADQVIDKHLPYYLGINHVLGLVGAFGAQRLADEELLLSAFRRFLAEQATAREGRPVSPLAEVLLSADTLYTKANLLTRLHGMDELTGPVDGQSVYVPFPNPVAAC